MTDTTVPADMTATDIERAAADKTKFYGVLCDEALAVAERRRWIGDRAKRNAREASARQSGDGGAEADPSPATTTGEVDASADLAVTVSPMMDGGEAVKDERGHPFPKISSRRDLVGLGLSGGGVRSAAFCLGVLQGLDAVVPDDSQPQILDAVDYLSTVSGGGYIGVSLAAGLRQDEGRFPFTSKLDQMETIGTQHLRDYANYLVPNGALDWAVGAVVVVRGLLINAFLVLGIILLAAAATAWFFPGEGSLHGPGLAGALDGAGRYGPAALAVAALAIFAGGVTFTAITLDRTPSRGALRLSDRERIDTVIAIAVLVCVVLAAVALQPVVLAGLFDAVHLNVCSDYAPQSGWLGRRLHAIGLGSGAPWKTLVTLTAGLWAFGNKFAKIAQAAFGDRSWSGILARWGSRIAIAVGATALPVAIWAAYLSMSFAAIGWKPWLGSAACCWHPGPPPGPLWMTALGLTPGELPLVYLLSGLFLGALSLLTPPNANSLHGFYRDRLSRAFLWDKKALQREAALRETSPPPAGQALFGLAPKDPTSDAADRLKLSGLKARDGGDPARWATDAGRTPYLLVNAAVNLEGSKYANRRGRNADAFIFAPLHSGSEATGYVATPNLEAADPHLDLATAMAISGAAASANMGASTIKPLTFSLALLNVRLGYWLPNPRRLDGTRVRFDRWQRLWPVAFAMEALGKLDEETPLVYLTDGGHFDNLGLYELVTRRCKVVIAVDAEADPAMNFEALIRLERCARIDLGVRIDLPWEDLRRWSLGVTVDAPHGPEDDPAACVGPHVALGRIEYGDDEPGVLIYIKSCITGDESDLIRDYRRRNPTFPHETTLDQFFTEEQFEVYRALGFHAAHSFFTGQDRFGLHLAQAGRAWNGRVGRALRRLNVPDEALAAIIARQVAPAPRPPAATPA